MKKPQILKLVDDALKKLKDNPDCFNGEQNTYRNQLLSTAVRLLSSIPEDSCIRDYVSFKRSVKKLIIEDFRSRSNRGVSEPFMKYVDQNFLHDFILQSHNIWHCEKHRWLPENVVFDYYEKTSLKDLCFHFVEQYTGHPYRWFKGLSEPKKTEILIARLELSKKGPSSGVIYEIIKSSDDSELFRLVAGYVDNSKLWNSVFHSDIYFDPESDEGIELIPIAEHLSPKLWILSEISSSDKMTKCDTCALDVKIEQIRLYFGHVNLPQENVLTIMSEALESNDFLKVEYCSKFLI